MGVWRVHWICACHTLEYLILFRFGLCQYLLISYDYYQFLVGCQSGEVERVTFPDQAAPNFVIYFTVYGF